MERLFNNQIQPQAQPLNSFIRPQQFQRANASQQPLLGQVSRVATLQQAGTSSVAGFNQFEQVATALAPFSKDLVALADKGMKFYAKSNIEAGYYDELQNQTVRSQLQTQRNQEQGAAEAAEVQSQLAKTDPVGASLFREANPWKAIGRRRALAQLAAGQVSSVLNADLSVNAGELGALRPGSPELMARKQMLTQQVYQRFGLTGDELEATYYITPQVNRSWDQYTQKQSELFTQELYDSTITATNASVASMTTKMVQDGMKLPDGTIVTAGDPRFAEVGAYNLTLEIDKALSLLGGEDKAKAWKKIQETLAYLRVNNPALTQVIQRIRVGPNSKYVKKDGQMVKVPIPYNERPLFANSSPVELQDMTTKAIKARNEAYTANQDMMQDTLEQLWNAPNGPGSALFGSEEYKNRLAEFQAGAKGMGFGDVEGWVQAKVNQGRSVAEATFNPSGTSVGQFEQRLRMLTPADLEGDNFTALLAEANAMAAQFVGDAKQQQKMEEYTKILMEARENLSKMPTGAALQGNLTRAVNEDLRDPEIDKLRNGAKFNSITQILEQAGKIPQGPARDQQLRYQRYANNLRSLYQIHIDAAFRDWRNNNPGRQQIPQAEQAVLIQEALQKARASKDYELLKKQALGPKSSTGQNNNQSRSSQPAAPANTNPNNGPVPRSAASTIPKNVARQYTRRVVMNPTWIKTELTRLANNQPVSKELYDLANKAGTSTDRYLLEQLRFFGPQLDPTGANRQELQRRVDANRTSSLPASANYAYAIDPRPANYNPRSPGAWLTSIYFPAQTA